MPSSRTKTGVDQVRTFSHQYGTILIAFHTVVALDEVNQSDEYRLKRNRSRNGIAKNWARVNCGPRTRR